MKGKNGLLKRRERREELKVGATEEEGGEISDKAKCQIKRSGWVRKSLTCDSCRKQKEKWTRKGR
jgi:hypothetical protein